MENFCEHPNCNQALSTGKRFCSLSCANSSAAIKRKERKIRAYEAAPLVCQSPSCEKYISYEKRNTNKFCSRRCSNLTTNNRKGTGAGTRPRVPTRKCLVCSTPTSNIKYCSNACNGRALQQKVWDEIEAGTYNYEHRGGGALRRYALANFPYECSLCGRSEWEGLPIALTLDHIDGDPSNNLVENLRLVCPNCDAISPTYQNRNKGNGREYRRKFYRKHGYA